MARDTVFVLCVSVAAVALLTGCGGRAADPVASDNALDFRLTCAHLTAERAANLHRIEDLRDERVDNRIRTATRVPGAIFGNPLSALALADTSRAIYVEIDALQTRNDRIDVLAAEKQCDLAPVPITQAVKVAIPEELADEQSFESYGALVVPADPVQPPPDEEPTATVGGELEVTPTSATDGEPLPVVSE
ncbi:MAG: hypothetical protein AAFV62_11245 [Pseudomonadota bacterium]